MDSVTDKELKEITDAIVKTVPAEKVYLFGSYAYGTPNADSDFDIYVVLPDNSLRPLEAMQKIGGVLFHIQKRSVDILAQKTSRFTELSQYPGLENTVLTKGIKLYG